MILTAEADGLPTGDKELLEDYGLQMTCQFHARIDSSGYARLLWESEDHRNGHAAIFEVKYRKKKGNKSSYTIASRVSERLSSSLGTWSLLHKLLKAMRIPLSPQQDASMTPSRGNW